MSRLSPGHLAHACGESIPRHVHGIAFAALVLSGGYVEAGDCGRHRAGPGDVIFHRPYDYHLNAVDRGGARVIVLTMPDGRVPPLRFGSLGDVDRVVALSEKDMPAALAEILRQFEPYPARQDDWPDMLAGAIQEDPSLCLSDWARRYGVAPGSVGRGFRQVYGVTPATYRLMQRTHRALDLLALGTLPLASVAQSAGFTDQAYMTRAIRRFTSMTPRDLLRRFQRS